MTKSCICSVWENYTTSILQMNEDGDDRYKLCEGNNENMNWKNIIIHDDIIYERKKGEFGLVTRLKGCEKTVLYFLKCSIFQECEDFENTNENKIVQWGHGKYSKRFILGSEKKLKNKNLELKKRNLELKKKNLELENKIEEGMGKEAIRVFKNMETLNGDYREYLKNADEDVIKYIQCCCDMFRNSKYKTTNKGTKYDLMF